jgi:hypothetical protein
MNSFAENINILGTDKRATAFFGTSLGLSTVNIFSRQSNAICVPSFDSAQSIAQGLDQFAGVGH